MGWWLAHARSGQQTSFLTRFDPRFWTVDFPRPMLASVVATAADALRVDAVFYRADDLAGLIWEAEDRHDHPLLAYETARDFRGCVLEFAWRSANIRALDAVNGPTLTIEGRDARGAPRAWFVRLWNYAQGTPEDAVVRIDFANLAGGFLLPAEADPVWAGDIDRMFISLVPPDYTPAGGTLAAPVEGWVELNAMRCTGSGSALTLGDVIVPEHGLAVASGYDDSYNLTPQRLLRGAHRLGYRGLVNHYVGMSHYQRLEAVADGFRASLAGGVLSAPCAAWHHAFAGEAGALGYEVIWSLSYELFDAYCWDDWKQRAADGSPALTGYVPPSTLLSPAHDGAMGYLRQVAAAFMALAVEAGLVPRFQAGEPWWWVTAAGQPCLYDAAARVALGAVPVIDLRAPQTAESLAVLDAAGVLLAASTAAHVDAARAAAPVCRTHVLAYLPTVLDPATPEARRLNLPLGWATPAFDVFQVEDYDWVTSGATALSAGGVAEIEARLGYPPARQHYLSGFVSARERGADWGLIDAAAALARRRGVARTIIWALPQILRDGFVHFDNEESDVQPFDDVLFPLALGREAEVAPGFSTAIATSAGGRETRNAAWASARARYDVGPGVRSEADIAILLDFYRARLGPARGFRLRDPFDWRSGPGDPTPLDQRIGTGDGATARFALVKHYGDSIRRITRPVAGSVRMSIDGAETGGFSVEPGGWIVFDVAPVAGASVDAGFAFDVPVRFAEDSLSVTRSTFLAGAAPAVPLIEIRED